MTENVDSVSKPLLVTSKVSFESPLQMVGSRIFLRPIEYMSESSNPFESEKRESIILFSYAFDKTEALNFALPGGWETEALPGDTIFENEVGICGVTFNVIGGKLTIQRKFELKTPFWNASEYDMVRDLYFARESQKLLTVTLIRTEKEGAIDSGD